MIFRRRCRTLDATFFVLVGVLFSNVSGGAERASADKPASKESAAVSVPETFQERILKEAESRLRAIYDREEFRAKRFRADWLPDSSGYTVLESVPDGKERVLVRYDAASGKRTVLDSTQREKSHRSGNVSPDGQSVLFSEQGNLYVRDLSSERKIPLTKNAADSPVSNSRAAWSPDGKLISFVQSDASRVKLRSVLVPGDPLRGQARFWVFASCFSMAARSFRKRALATRCRSIRRTILPALSGWLRPNAVEISRRVADG